MHSPAYFNPGDVKAVVINARVDDPANDKTVALWPIRDTDSAAAVAIARDQNYTIRPPCPERASEPHQPARLASGPRPRADPDSEPVERMLGGKAPNLGVSKPEWPRPERTGGSSLFDLAASAATHFPDEDPDEPQATCDDDQQDVESEAE